MLSRALDTYADLNKPKDEEWIRILLSFLQTYVDDAGEQWLMHAEDKLEYISNLVGAMSEAARNLESGDESTLIFSVYRLAHVLPSFDPF